MSSNRNEKNAAPSASEGQGGAKIRLKDLILLGLPASGVYLIHTDTDVGFVPAADLPWLSMRGKEQFAPLLDAVVEGIGPGAYGTELKLCGVEPRVLADYDQRLADEAAGRVTGMFLPDRHSAAVEALERPPGQSACPEEAVRAVRDFVCFERDTSQIWPWFISAEEILGDEGKLREIGAALRHDPTHGYDTEEIYSALTETFGVNPVLEQGRLEAARKEAHRIFSAFRIKEGGQERLLRVDGEKEFLDAAVILRRYIRGESPGSPSCLADCYFPSHSISEAEFNAMVDLRLQNTGKVAGAFDIDIDKGKFSALHIMDGWQTFSVKDVSAAAYRAMWNGHMRESERWELFLDALDGKEFSQQPTLDAGPQLGV